MSPAAEGRVLRIPVLPIPRAIFVRPAYQAVNIKRPPPVKTRTHLIQISGDESQNAHPPNSGNLGEF